MALLHVTGLKKSFGEHTVFSGISFDVFERDRIGLIGVNGCGKTTLFRILTGADTPDEGGFGLAKGARLEALDQSPVWEKDVTLYDAALEAFRPLIRMEEELGALSSQMEQADTVTDAMLRRQDALQQAYERGGGMTFRSRTRAALLGLGFTDEEIRSEMRHMSGGQMRKAELARALLSEADLLLLDEPTNHLDIVSIEWLEEYLSNYAGAFLVVSHDRYFLDHVCTRMLEMENGGMTAFRGNYSTYTEHKMDEREYAMRRYQNGMREIKRLEGVIEQQRRWNQERNYVTIASKQKQIERLQSALVKPDDLPASIRFHLRAEELTANEVVVCRHLDKRFGSTRLFTDLNLLIRNGERVCLLGANGCGKTTLLRILLGQEPPDGGVYRLGANVHVGYFSQSTTHTDKTNTVLDEVCDAYPFRDRQEIRNLLGAFLFRGDDVYKRLNTLSGGELARVQMLKLMLSGSNVLFLDEPTNHLDIPSREALENALVDYGGTMLVITHDRYFANRIADRILRMDYDGLTEFEGDWDSYKIALKERAEAEQPEKPAPQNDYVRAKQHRSAVLRAKTALTNAEKTIHALEAEIDEAESALNDPALSMDYQAAAALCERMAEKRRALEGAYAGWEAAQAAYDALSGEEA